MMNDILPPGFIPPHKLAGMPPETPILIAFSGGPDSSALLSMLVLSAKETGAPLYAAHIDHMIRDDEHERDRLFCETTAKKHGVRFFALTADIPALACESKESKELCARRIRYEFFEKTMNENNISLLVTAHNADDNLETLLLSMIRGSGLQGMCGIPPVRAFGQGMLVRPLLNMTKSEILEYCKQNSIEYVTDSTNAIPDCSRNRIRLNVIPELKAINSAASENASRLCETLREDNAFLCDTAASVEKASNGGLLLNALNNLPPAIVSRVLFNAFGPGLETVHIKALYQLCAAGVPHSSLSLPDRKRAVIENGCLYFENESEPKDSEPFNIRLAEGENKLSDSLILLISSHKPNVYKSEIHAAIASDKIIGNLYARNRLPGDKIRLHGVGKSVKKLMCDLKIPIELRNSLPVICDELGIVYIPMIGVRDGLSDKNYYDMTYITLITG